MKNENEIIINTTDLDSIAEAISAGITTPELMADYLGIDLIDDCLVLDDSPIYADDGNSEIEYPSDTEPRDAAQQYVEGGDWRDSKETCWVSVWTYRKGVDSKGDIVEVDRDKFKIAIEPTEPECTGGEHVWASPYSIVGGLKENPGVFGSGGGVVIHEVCMCCGCEKTTDTWAQDMSDGEQGLESVCYQEAKYADEVRERQISKAKKELDTEEDQSTDEFDFIWTDESGDLVGADEDDLAEFGRALYREDSNLPAIGTELKSTD